MKRIVASILCSAALGASANGVTDWSAIAERVATDKRPPAAAEVILGVAHAAMYDAVAATSGGMKPILATGVAPARGDPDVAAAVAAHEVLKARVPAHAASLDAELSRWMGGRGDSAAVRAGETVGREVARAVLERRAADGFDAKAEWRAREEAHGVWQPTAATSPVDLGLGRVRPIVATDLTRFRPAAPDFAGEAHARELAEVRALGRKDSTARTAQQTETAMFWSDPTALQWSRALRGLAQERNLDTRESARMLAMAHVSAADALILCFDTKYHYMSWRPIHAIRRAKSDADATWDSLLNVNHPEYPSGHSCFTGAMTEALARCFGTRDLPVTITSTTTKTSRRYRSVDEVNADVTEARILSGLHFRGSMVAGTKLGADVAAEVIRTRLSRARPTS
jgi:hypothetical protein